MVLVGQKVKVTWCRADGRAAKVEDLSDKAQWESRAEQSRAAQRIGRVKSSDRVSSGGRNGVGRGGGVSRGVGDRTAGAWVAH